MKTPPSEAFAQFFVQKPIPVFAHTSHALLELYQHHQDLLSSDISQTLLYDPFFTLHLIKHLAQLPSKRRLADITTVDHAIMMLGIEPFFTHFSQPQIVEQNVQDPQTLQSLYLVARRSYVSGQLALRLAQMCKDMEPEEIQVAALLHDMAEMFLWLIFPQKAQAVSELMRQYPTQRSHLLQKQILGFPLVEVELSLCQHLHLPELLVDLISNKHSSPFSFQSSSSRRMQTVLLSVRTARHLSKSFQDPGLADDFLDIAQLVKTPLDIEFCIEIQNFALTLALNWEQLYCPNLPLPAFGADQPFYTPMDPSHLNGATKTDSLDSNDTN